MLLTDKVKGKSAIVVLVFLAQKSMKKFRLQKPFQRNWDKSRKTQLKKENLKEVTIINKMFKKAKYVLSSRLQKQKKDSSFTVKLKCL